jgi:hypothetical protein
MNKKDYIESEREKNRMKFGRWASTSKKGSADPKKLIMQPPPKDDVEVLQHCNALFNEGHYPIVTDPCFNVGISGGCGLECFVYLNGECGEPDEMLSGLTQEEMARHEELYPKRKAQQ